MPSIYRQTTPKTRLPRPSQRLPARLPAERKGGFAVLIALSLMSFVLVIVLSLILMASVETANAANSKDRLLARENARLGLMIALGDLQKYAGPDQRVTARAEVLGAKQGSAEMWSGIWDTSSGTPLAPVWLVSGEQPDPVAGPDTERSIEIWPVTPGADAVLVETQAISGSNNQENGSFAFWAEEQGVKARINRRNETDRMSYLVNFEDAQNITESVLTFPAPEKIFEQLVENAGRGRESSGGKAPIKTDVVDQLARIQTSGQVGLVLPNSSDDFAVSRTIRDQHHHFTVSSAGVLENPLVGGLKKNLTGRTREDLDDLLQQSNHEDDHYLRGDYLDYFNLDPESGLLLPKTTNVNNPANPASSFNSNGELALSPVSDFYDFRQRLTTPDDGVTEPVRNIMPVISEVSFRMGAFHTQSDAKHRIRFHVDVEFWNPYPFPIRMPNSSQDRVFVMMMVPSALGEPEESNAEPEQMILSVQKMGAGRGRGGDVVQQEIHTNLFNFDEDLGSVLGGGSTPNELNRTVLQSWMVIDDVVLQPGEVYHATTEQSQGLARDLGGYILRSGGDPEDAADYIPDPNHDYNKWSWDTVANPTYVVLEADARVEVNLRLPENGITFRMIAFDTQIAGNTPPFYTPVYEEDTNNAWAKPLWELRHVLKNVANPPTLVLRGDEYSRGTSGSYTANNFNIGFHFRLADELVIGSEPDASDLALRFDLRQPVWDYDSPAVRELIEITDENPFAISQLQNLFDGTDVLADNQPDSHNGGFQRAFLYTAPQGEPLSIGALHRLPLSLETVDYDATGSGTVKPVQMRIGKPWAGDLNEAFDKFFYSGAATPGWSPELPLPLAALQPSPDVTTTRIREIDVASDLLVEGAFNVNSLSETAWAAMLSRTLHQWEYGTAPPVDIKNAFLNFADGTDRAMSAIGSITADDVLTAFDPSNAGATEDAGRLAMRHPIRLPADAAILELAAGDDEDSTGLAAEVVREIAEHINANGPFTTISEFVTSGVFERAIRSSGINGNVAKYSPAYIAQSTVLEALAPYLTVRSDTFMIHAFGAYLDPITGVTRAQTICQAVVQRRPARMDGDSNRISEASNSNGNLFGREFVIVDIQWKEGGL